MFPFRRRRFDPQPSEPCAVLLCSDGRRDFSRRAVAEAAALGEGGTVAVVTIARIHGSQFGIPHPGLLPSKQEIAERRKWLERAVRRLERAGSSADAQLALTRKPTKTLTRIARTRRPAVIVIDETFATGLRRVVEGDVGGELRTRLGRDGIEVRVIPHVATEKPTLSHT